MPLATTPCRLARALSLAFSLLFFAGSAQAQWVNELHYDNDGADEGEAVEVVLPSAADPAAYDLYLYNGSNGAVYGGPFNLATDFTAGATESGYTIYSAAIAGIQNGSPDGLALTENGAVVPGQFLSYEGTFEATDGPAAGQTSTDIGVEEGSGTAIGQSLQLTGTGAAYADFTWTGPVADSFGAVNDGQTLQAGGTPVVAFTESGATVAEGNEVTLTVRLDFPNDMPDGNPVTVTVAFDEEASTADEADFGGPTPTQLTFDGTTDEEEQSVTVTVIGGDGFEGEEVAVFDLFVAGGIAETGTPSSFALTIEDGEAPDPARVQVIHNAADPFMALVDISIVATDEGGDGASFNDVPFRAATPFFDLAPGTYQVTVTDEEDLAVVIIDETVTVASDGTYQLVANGVADPSQFEDNPNGQSIAATLFVNDTAREASTTPGFVQIVGVHGSTDTPAVDVRETSTSTAIVDGAIYGDIGEYVDVPPGEYTIEVTTDDESLVLGTVYADVSGLGGQAVTVLASGFLTPQNDQDGPYIGLLAVLPDGTSFLLPYVVDIAGARDLPLGSPVQIEGVVTRAMGDFTRMQDETAGLVIRQTEGPFNEDVADGTIAPGTELRVTGSTSEFRQLFQINAGDLISYEVLGTTDVPAPQLVTLEEIAVDGEAYESELIQVENLFIEPDGDTVFQPATSYNIADPTRDDSAVTLRIPNEGDTAINGEPIPSVLATFTGVLGQFDFDDPAAGYQLNPVQADDVVAQDVVTTPVQIIHNAPDPAFAEVDVYVDGALALDDFAFRSATPFDGLPADVEIEVAIAPGDSEGPEDALFTEAYTLDSELNYQLIASGVGEGDFEPNPDGEDITFTLLVNPDAKLFSETDDTLSDFNFVHGTPDAPTIDLVESASFEVLYDDVAYGDVTGYLPIPPDIGAVQITTAEGNELTPLFSLPLEERVDEAGTILASGFLSTNDEPDGAPRLGLLVVFADGTTEFLEPFILPNTEDDATMPTTFAVDGNYPNPFASETTLRYDLPVDAEVSVEVYDVLGRRVVEVAPEAVAAGAGRTVTLDAALPSGAYIYRVTAEMPTETRTETGRMTVVR
jgi:hypothetical protein